MTDREPERFGSYILLDKIGQGGLGELFRARPLPATPTASHPGFQLDGDDVVAVKRIRPELVANPDFRALFLREATLSSRLVHPNIVEVHDFGQVLDNVFIVLEHVDGPDLRRVLHALARTGRPVPVRFALEIATRCARALAYAHSHTLHGQPAPVVHRDVTPGNVLLAYDGTVKLADFGIAIAEQHGLGEGLDARRYALGKAAYTAPELARGGDPTIRSDVWSLGVLLWEMLTGRPLFYGPTRQATFERVLHAEIVPPSTHNRQVGKALDAVVLRCLARDPARRYSDADAIAFALDHLAEDAAVDVHHALGAFLRELFAEDYAASADRLEDGLHLARALKLHEARADGEPADLPSSPTMDLVPDADDAEPRADAGLRWPSLAIGAAAGTAITLLTLWLAGWL